MKIKTKYIKILQDILYTIIKDYPFSAIRYVVGSLIVGILQVLSIGSLYPVISSIISTQSKPNKVIEFFNHIFAMIGLNATLFNFLIFFISICIFSAIVFILVEVDQGYLLKHLEVKIRSKLVKTVIEARWAELRDIDHGEFINAVTQEAQLNKIIIKYSFMIISAFIQILCYCFYIFQINIKFALISLFCFVLGFIIFMPMMKISNQLGHKWTNAYGRLTSNLLNVARAFKNIKAGSLEKYLLNYIKPYIANTSTIYYHQQILTAIQSKSSELTGALILSFLIFIGFKVMGIETTTLLIVLLMLSRLSPKVKEITDSFHRTFGAIPSIVKIQDIKKSCIAKENIQIGKRLIGSSLLKINFKSVGFQYNTSKILFKDVNAEFKKGDFWAICGPTGSGKTTILDLISRIIDASTGRIVYNDISSNDVSITSLHKRLGYLTQESFIFTGTMLKNICWGIDRPDLSKIDSVVKLSHLGDLIKEKTIKFMISESGQNLSGGQKQRIAIARLMMNDYDFILMDEPTSALDLDTEQKFISTLKYFKGKVGIIISTHRKEYLKYADWILKIKNGKITVEKQS